MLLYTFTLGEIFLASTISAVSSQMVSKVAKGRIQNDQNSKQTCTHGSSVDMTAEQMEPDNIPWTQMCTASAPTMWEDEVHHAWEIL